MRRRAFPSRTTFWCARQNCCKLMPTSPKVQTSTSKSAFRWVLEWVVVHPMPPPCCVALNRVWGLGFDADQLAALGLQLGADVPVFVHGHNAWAEGIGERLTRLELPPAWYVLASPGVHAATAALFQEPDLTRDAAPATISDFVSGTVLDNAFESVLRRREPAVEALFIELARIGRPRLTGSGSVCFVEFAHRGSAEDALAGLPPGINAWLARGAERSPLLDAVENFKVGASPSG